MLGKTHKFSQKRLILAKKIKKHFSTQYVPYYFQLTYLFITALIKIQI